MTIGDRIKLLREERNMTQTDVAKYIGSATQTIFKYEKNLITNIPVDNIEKMAELFNVSPAYILGWDITPAPAPDKEISGIDVMIATESKDLSDKDKNEILHLIQYKKQQKENEDISRSEKPIPFESSRVYTTANFDDDTERIAAFGGMEDDDDEPFIT